MICKVCRQPIGGSYVHDRDRDAYYHISCALARFPGPLRRRVRIRTRKRDLFRHRAPKGIPLV